MPFENSVFLLADRGIGEGDGLPKHDDAWHERRSRLLKFIAEDVTDWLGRLEEYLGLEPPGPEPVMLDKFLKFTRDRMKRIEDYVQKNGKARKHRDM